MASKFTRRRLLAAAAAVGSVGVAGCLGSSDGPVPEPIVTSDRIDDGWRLVEESSGQVFEESFGPVTVEALQRTLVYEYVSVAEAVAEALDADGSPVLFFTTRIDLRPSIDGLPFGLGRAEVMAEVESAAETAFREQLENGGIEDVERTGTTTVEVDSGHEATEFGFVGRFPVEGELDLVGGLTAPIAGEFEIESRLAVWHDGTDVLLAGGAYPSEPLESVFEDALGDESVDLADVFDEALVDTLSAGPETYADEVEALLLSVE